MSADFEELDYQRTPLGELSLRRRRVPSLEGTEIFEVKLGDDFLMSSLFSDGETALARLALAATPAPEPDVVVGGLGLGYTASAALDSPRVRSVLVIDALPEVIRWHHRKLVPLGGKLAADPRCRLVCGDFFALAAGADGFDHDEPGRRFDAILLDVDHSPRHVLHPRHAALYEASGLAALARFLQPGGVLALWSNDPPDAAFVQALETTFTDAQPHVVKFRHPVSNREAANTVYVARRG